MAAGTCVYRRFIAAACAPLMSHGLLVRIATVTNFLDGESGREATVRETAEMVVLGADRIDFVFPNRELIEQVRIANRPTYCI